MAADDFTTGDSEQLSRLYLEKARALVTSLEAGDQADADRLINEITKQREESLFRELGKLTREFHEALNTFRLDARLATLAEESIPDARDRLLYVITMTEQAADRSLNAVEEALPVCDRLEQGATELGERWARFVRREMDVEEFRRLSSELQAFFSAVPAEISAVRERLQEVLMAQEFQDLTGQIIRRVITLVEDLELSLVDLIRISGQNLVPPSQMRGDNATGRKSNPGSDVHGPAVPGVDHSDIVSGQDEVDDLLSSLGF